MSGVWKALESRCRSSLLSPGGLAQPRRRRAGQAEMVAQGHVLPARHVVEHAVEGGAALGRWTSAVVLSAFRTPETNAMLARTTFGVAENSQHLYGRALDVRFPARLAEAMTVARAMRRGGVGWYPHSGFIHLDTGPVRNWDLDEDGLQDLLIARRPTPAGPNQKGEMLVSGPGTLIVGRGRPPVVLPGRVLSAGDLFRRTIARPPP
jgi:hypothetical protein